MAKFKDFLEKNRHFIPLSTTFGIVASVALILTDGTLPPTDAETYQKTMLAHYDDNYLTLHPMEWQGEGKKHYFTDIPYQHYSEFSHKFCDRIVPTVLMVEGEEPRTQFVSRTTEDTEAKNRLSRYDGYISTHPKGIDAANAGLHNTMQEGYSYNQAFSLASTFSCQVGSALKGFMMDGQSYDFTHLEQSLLKAFNNVLARIDTAMSWNTYSPERYSEVLDRVLDDERQNIIRESDKRKEDRNVFPSFALKF